MLMKKEKAKKIEREVIKKTEFKVYNEAELIEIIAYTLDILTPPAEIDLDVEIKLHQLGREYPVDSVPFLEERQQYLYDRANRILDQYRKNAKS